jgi:methylmalonyl-CoA mutase
MTGGKDIFGSFEGVSTAAWLERISADLKGKDLGETLTWISREGLRIKPFYNSDDLIGRSRIPESRMAGKWHLIERIDAEVAEKANAAALAALNNGAESIVFDLNGRALTSDILESLVSGIRTDIAPVVICNYGEMAFEGPLEADINVLDDGLLYALRKLPSGETFGDEAFWAHWREAADSIHANGRYSFTIDASVFKEAGADCVQELAFSLGLAHEYLQRIEGSRLRQVRFRTALAGNFFFEIAKLRAIRKLWKVLSAIHSDEEIPLYVEAVSARINKSWLDSHSNMLRNTAECMAAVFGRADGICISGHDIAGEDREGRHWAGNIHHLLRHESHLDGLADPAAGSYYVESLTDDLASAAWDAFREMERNGGFTEAWNAGQVDAGIGESLARLQNGLARRELTLIGVNDFPNTGEETPAGGTVNTSDLRLPPVRLAEPFEALRVKTMTWGKANDLPSIILFGVGKAALSSARMNFASNFLACAGFASTEMTEAEESVLAGGQYDLVVLCSDNESWGDWLPRLRRANAGRLWLAGDPSTLGPAVSDCLDGAMFKGCNVLEKLEELQNTLLR